MACDRSRSKFWTRVDLVSLSTADREAAYGAGTAIVHAVRRREAAACRLRPSELLFGTTPKAERVRGGGVTSRRVPDVLAGFGYKTMDPARAPAAKRLTRSWPGCFLLETSMTQPPGTHIGRNTQPADCQSLGKLDESSDIGATIETLRDNELQSILCVGSGASSQPATLAACGLPR